MFRTEQEVKGILPEGDYIVAFKNTGEQIWVGRPARHVCEADVHIAQLIFVQEPEKGYSYRAISGLHHDIMLAKYIVKNCILPEGFPTQGFLYFRKPSEISCGGARNYVIHMDPEHLETPRVLTPAEGDYQYRVHAFDRVDGGYAVEKYAHIGGRHGRSHLLSKEHFKTYREALSRARFLAGEHAQEEIGYPFGPGRIR
jgi:hypothetical protein